FFNIHRKKQNKWTNYILTDEEINFIEDCKEKCNFTKIINFASKIEVGIVTAANHFFILNQDHATKYSLNEFAYPIVQKSSVIKNKFFLDDELINSLNDDEIPAYLIQIDDKPKMQLDRKLRDYIAAGEEELLHQRFKMKKRNNWYHVPEKWIADLFFIKRSHLFPRICINKSKYRATDALYHIKVLPLYEAESLACSFYNTLTFIDCELNGRYYGGGVLELTPNEFKGTCIRYQRYNKSSQFDIDKFIKDKNIEGLLQYNNSIVLNELNDNYRLKLNKIYQKLLARRLRK
ncbi:MAG: hypothetical protein AAF433_07360, partial [Bacteroidota bacterium]